jgi:S1-C subfamily serine protease
MLEYAGTRVFAPGELQQLIASGRPGELVSIEVVRGGEPLTLRAPRGPLGIVLEATRRVPEGGC